MNIVLTGFMGTGKSTVGALLAERLSLKLVDTDELIEAEAGLSVKEIFSKFGEERFRSMESAVVARLGEGGYGSGLVVSTGGGIVIDPANRGLLKEFATVVCLTAQAETILKRVGSGDERPLLDDSKRLETIETMLDERRAYYAECDLTIDTTDLGPEEVATLIMGRLK